VLKGAGAHLADDELLELPPCGCISRIDVKPIAKELIKDRPRARPAGHRGARSPCRGARETVSMKAKGLI